MHKAYLSEGVLWSGSQVVLELSSEFFSESLGVWTSIGPSGGESLGHFVVWVEEQSEKEGSQSGVSPCELFASHPSSSWDFLLQNSQKSWDSIFEHGFNSGSSSLFWAVHSW